MRDGDREMEGKRGMRGTRTLHHHHEQLLVGWFVGEMNPDGGARWLGDDQGRDEMNEGVGQE